MYLNPDYISFMYLYLDKILYFSFFQVTIVKLTLMSVRATLVWTVCAMMALMPTHVTAGQAMRASTVSWKSTNVSSTNLVCTVLVWIRWVKLICPCTKCPQDNITMYITLQLSTLGNVQYYVDTVLYLNLMYTKLWKTKRELWQEQKCVSLPKVNCLFIEAVSLPFLNL